MSDWIKATVAWLVSYEQCKPQTTKTSTDDSETFDLTPEQIYAYFKNETVNAIYK